MTEMTEVYMLQPVTPACDLFAPIGSRRPHREPKLADLLSDPITRALMQADRVDHRDLETLLDDARANLRS